MFTIKLYSHNEHRSRVLSAESFTILRNEDGTAEITLHQRNSVNDSRVDIAPPQVSFPDDKPPRFDRAIIENANGKTTEIIEQRPGARTPERAAS